MVTGARQSKLVWMLKEYGVLPFHKGDMTKYTSSDVYSECVISTQGNIALMWNGFSTRLNQRASTDFLCLLLLGESSVFEPLPRNAAARSSRAREEVCESRSLGVSPSGLLVPENSPTAAAAGRGGCRASSSVTGRDFGWSLQCSAPDPPGGAAGRGCRCTGWAARRSTTRRRSSGASGSPRRPRPRRPRPPATAACRPASRRRSGRRTSRRSRSSRARATTGAHACPRPSALGLCSLSPAPPPPAAHTRPIQWRRLPQLRGDVAELPFRRRRHCAARLAARPRGRAVA